MPSFGLPYWLDLPRPVFPSLTGHIRADVVVVGGGICGTKLAFYLAKHGLKTVVLEADRVGQGASGRNGGAICTSSCMLYHEAIEQLTPRCGAAARELARELWRLGAENHAMAKAQMEELEIDCDYQKEGFHFLARADAPAAEDTLAQFRRDYEWLGSDGFAVGWMDRAEAVRRGGSPLYLGGLSYLEDAQFHSGKYVVGVAEGVVRSGKVRLFEHSRVQRIETQASSIQAVTAHGTVSASHTFLAANALAPQLVPALDSEMRAERGQAFVTEPLDQRPCRGNFTTHIAWWREIPQPDGRWRLLYGGARHYGQPDSLFRQFDEAGRTHPKLLSEGSMPTDVHQRRIDEQFQILFPRLASVRRTHRWGGLQCFTGDHLPTIGLFDPTRRIHGLAGFSGRGNTYTDVGAEVLAARVAGATSTVERRYGGVIDRLLQPGRPSAQQAPWTTPNA